MLTSIFHWIVNAAAVMLIYTGFGFLVSRFFASKIKNNPLTWLVFSVVIFPIFIGTQSLFFKINPSLVLLESVFSWIIAICCMRFSLLRNFKFSLLQEKKGVQWWEICIYIAICTAFLIMIITPKISLLTTNGAAVNDDYNNINKLISTGFNLTSPKFFHMPTLELYYYYYDYLLSGTIFRITSLHAQGALFIHNVLEYIAFLSIFGYITFFLFKKPTSRIFFALCCTFFSGGWDYFILSILNKDSLFMTSNMEWWTGEFGLRSQISSFYTLFLWTPQHLIAGMTFLIILLLTVNRKNSINKLLIPILLAGILGFSSFVFITCFLTYAAIELFYFFATNDKRYYFKWLSFQIPIFSIFALRPFLVYSGQKSPLFHEIVSITLIKPSLFSLNTYFDQLMLALLPFINFLLSIIFILLIDLGIIFIFAVMYYIFFYNNKKDKEQRIFVMYSLIALVISIAVIFQFQSSGNNELFMRGIIVSQVTIVIAAALLLERLHVNKYIFSTLLIVVFVIQFMGIYAESTRFRKYPLVDFPNIYTNMRENLPKDAVIFTNVVNSQGHFECQGVTFQGNRMCFQNSNEIDFWRGQYAKNRQSEKRDFHDLNTVKDIELRNKYYLSSKIETDPFLTLVWTDYQSYLYSID